MLKKFIYIVILQLAVIVLYGQDCTCRSFVPKHLQPRGTEKVVKSKGNTKTREEVIDVNYIYKWEEKYRSSSEKLVWNDFRKRSRRKENTPEDTVYQLKGYLWFVKKVGFDCDYHMEIGTADSAGTRIVVEIPHMYLELQKKVQVELIKRHLPLLYCTTKNESDAHFKKGIPILIKGYGFYDAYHKPNTNHGDAHTKKYTWELHPVIDIEFLNE